MLDYYYYPKLNKLDKQINKLDKIDKQMDKNIQKDSFDEMIDFDEINPTTKSQPIINDKIEKEIILKLRMSTKLKNVLKTLQHNNHSKKIADSLIENIKELPCDISFFNLSSENTKLSCLNKDKISRLEKTIKKNNKYSLGSYKSTLRQEIRIGKIINNLFPNIFTPMEIESFVNEFKCEHDLMNGIIDIKFVSGEDLYYWYKYENYNQRAGGPLNNSCMRSVDKKILQLYIDNPNQVKLAIFTKNNKLEARALIWETNHGTYMDRIYYTQDHIKNIYEKYALDHNWLYRETLRERNLTVSLDHGKYVYTPYFDSFRYNGTKKLVMK
jgi:hypothetical protein